MCIVIIYISYLPHKSAIKTKVQIALMIVMIAPATGDGGITFSQ